MEAARPEPVHRDVEEGLAVRLLVQRPLVDVLARADRAALLDCRGEVEDALGPQEERVQRRQLRALELEALVQP